MEAPQGCSTGFQGWWNRKRSTLQNQRSQSQSGAVTTRRVEAPQGCSTDFQGGWNRKRSALRSPHSKSQSGAVATRRVEAPQGCSTAFQDGGTASVPPYKTSVPNLNPEP
ncbi:MAG: hypothetical protein WDM70_09155 [Nitrosomonadales bacterium]